MRVVISGAGDVGFHLARQLSHEGHYVALIDKDERKLAMAEQTLECLTVHGHAASPATLIAAGVETADLCLAVTSTEETNVVTALLARQLGVKSSLARLACGELADPETPVDIRFLGVDHLIYPEELAAQEIVKLIERTDATDIVEFEEGRLMLLGLKLDENAHPILNRRLDAISKDFEHLDFRIVLVKRSGHTHVPARDFRPMPGDQIIVMTMPEGADQVLKLAGKQRGRRFENIMVLGGGKIGRMVATAMEKRYNVKLIEADRKKSFELVDTLPDTLVIQGDGRDIELLEEESLGEMDAFIAVTEDAETNVIACLLARQNGVRKTIAHVENAEYARISETIGVDALINKKIIAAQNIARLVRQANIVALAQLHGMDAEALEFVAPKGSPVTKKPLRDLKFPQGAIIGGVIRPAPRGSEDESATTFIAVGDTQILPNDRVVVFAMPSCIDRAQSFFRAE